MSELRTLSIRVTPLPGESMDSWLEALARRCWMPVPSLLSALHLPPPERIHQFVTSMPEQHLRTLEECLQLPSGRLDQTVTAANLFGRRAPSCRFCPQCLNETQGRWILRWWLPWTFACTRHHALLHFQCHRCHRPPRESISGKVPWQRPGECTHKPPQRRGSCGTDLRFAPPLPLSPQHPLLGAQEQLDAIPVHGHRSVDLVFADVDRLLTELTSSYSSDGLSSTDAKVRRAWERMLDDVTNPVTEIGRWRLRSRTRTFLTPQFLHREHEVRKRSLREIAKSFDLPERLVVQRAKALGIKVQPAGTRPHPFDDNWLREQYVVQLRSLGDISHETGACTETVTRRLTKLGIARRPAGSRSRREMLVELDDSVHHDIRAAVEGTLHGWVRLRRFQINMAFPTVSATANYLNVEHSALSMQFSQMERAIGGELFHRSTGHTPQWPTSRGLSLLQQLGKKQARELMHQVLGRKMTSIPDREAVSAAQTAFGAESRTLTDLCECGQPPPRINVPLSLLPLTLHLLSHPDQEVYTTQLHTSIGLPLNTIYKQLRRLEASGWLLSRRESAAERPHRGGRGRIYYTLTATARLVPLQALPSAS
ncbi:TniQ family protein [Streptomyces sp. NPDC091287]|uniref:TniQ family protein n=1 Tax=Streptomyces sp. NPDC091287 TaxID=3365988 RepID=UPI0037F6AC49